MIIFGVDELITLEGNDRNSKSLVISESCDEKKEMEIWTRHKSLETAKDMPYVWVFKLL